MRDAETTAEQTTVPQKAMTMMTTTTTADSQTQGMQNYTEIFEMCFAGSVWFVSLNAVVVEVVNEWEVQVDEHLSTRSLFRVIQAHI